jgi:hypothetical protein
MSRCGKECVEGTCSALIGVGRERERQLEAERPSMAVAGVGGFDGN